MKKKALWALFALTMLAVMSLSQAVVADDGPPGANCPPHVMCKTAQ